MHMFVLLILCLAGRKGVGGVIVMSRAKVFGPGSTHSLTKLGTLARDMHDPIPQRLKDAARLEAQKFVRSDTERTRRYALCTKCGVTTVTIGFDTTPSARIGLWGRCVDDKDYTHHRFVAISQAEYTTVRDWSVDRRLNHWRFESGR